MKAIAAAAMAMLVLAACSRGGALGVGSEAECVGEFAVPAGTERGVRYAYGFCRELFAADTSQERQDYLECMLPKVSAARNNLGMQAAAHTCNAG